MALKHLLSACSLLAILPLASWADIYGNIKYGGGYPGFNPTKEAGTLHIGHEGVCFKSDTQAFLIEYPSIKEQSYESQTKNKGLRGVTVVAPGAVALATSLGASLLGNIITLPRGDNTHFYRIRFTDRNQGIQEVTFRVPNENVRRKIMDDVQLNSREELYNVMMQGSTPPKTRDMTINLPVATPLEIPSEESIPKQPPEPALVAPSTLQPIK